jgi:hypothetical protein
VAIFSCARDQIVGANKIPLGPNSAVDPPVSLIPAFVTSPSGEHSDPRRLFVERSPSTRSRRGRPNSICYECPGRCHVGSGKCPCRLCFACSTSYRLGERADVVSFSGVMFCLVGMEYFRAYPRGCLMQISFITFPIRSCLNDLCLVVIVARMFCVVIEWFVQNKNHCVY